MNYGTMNYNYYDIGTRLINQPLINGMKELLNYQFTINPNANIAFIREPSLKYILAENIWYFSGSQSSKWIGKFANLWNNITDDGETANSAYGHIIFKRHGFNQLTKVLYMLRHDKNTRRAFININVPHANKLETKDEPCTIGLNLNIRENKLYMTCMMRSNDVWFGLPYDVIFFTELQKYIARSLNIEVGSYTHFVTSLHMYEKDETKLANKLYDFIMEDTKEFKVDFKKLIEQSSQLYNIVNKENILDVCKERGII